jgi:hypothetical protein
LLTNKLTDKLDFLDHLMIMAYKGGVKSKPWGVNDDQEDDILNPIHSFFDPFDRHFSRSWNSPIPS